jgi:hypothetical protein
VTWCEANALQRGGERLRIVRRIGQLRRVRILAVTDDERDAGLGSPARQRPCGGADPDRRRRRCRALPSRRHRRLGAGRRGQRSRRDSEALLDAAEGLRHALVLCTEGERLPVIGQRLGVIALGFVGSATLIVGPRVLRRYADGGVVVSQRSVEVELETIGLRAPGIGQFVDWFEP